MIFKLSMTGLKSRLKDYLVLFSGLSAASMTFYMFLTLAANQSFLKSSVAGRLTMGATKFIFSFGIVLFNAGLLGIRQQLPLEHEKAGLRHVHDAGGKKRQDRPADLR